MRLTSIGARNWMAYETLHLEVGDLTAFAITGENNMGKSAIQNAVTMALYGRVGRDIDARQTDLLARRGSDGWLVRVGFTTPDGHEVEVTREKPLGRTMTLGLVVDGVSQRGHIIGREEDEEASLDETQARIIGLVGLTYDQLVAGPFMVQQGAEGKSSSFLKASPGARKDLLIRLLGLDVFERLHTEAKTRAEVYGATATSAALRVAELEPVVAAGETLMADLEAARVTEATMVRAVREAAQAAETAQSARNAAVLADSKRRSAVARLQRATEGLTRGQARVTSCTTALERAAAAAVMAPPVLVEVPADGFDREALITADDAVQAAQAKVNERYVLVGQFNALQTEVERAERGRAILPTVPCGGEGIYAACQFLRDVPPASDVETARTSLENTRALLTDAETVDGDLATAKARWKTLYDGLGAHERAEQANAAATSAYKARMDEADRTLTQAQTNMAEAEAELARATTEAEASIAEAEAAGPEPDMTGLDAAVREAQRQHREEESNLDTFRRETLRPLDIRAGVLEQAVADLALMQIKRQKASRIEGVYRTLAAAWHRDGIPTALLEQAVPLIESKANSILERFPQDLRVTLRTQRPTKKGGMAEKLDIVVSIGGEDSDPGLLSVGANFRVDIALRMALSDVQGARIETLWLDEPLAALDTAGKEAVVTTLAALQEDFGLMVAVSHHPDFNDALPAQLNITQEARVATATWI